MIIYEAEGVKFPNIMKRETTAWIRKVAASYGKKVGEIGYLFVNDDKILEVNNQFLGHDYYTDIITLSSVVHTMKSCIVLSFTAFCTCVASTIRDRASVR